MLFEASLTYRGAWERGERGEHIGERVDLQSTPLESGLMIFEQTVSLARGLAQESLKYVSLQRSSKEK